MDKQEYQEKLNEINRLIAIEDYESAAQVADSIDWKRVRNVQTLLMVAEIYEAVNRYPDSKILLLRAYRRSPLGRTVLYRLVECTVALGQFDEAIEYYSEYVQAAPRDNNKYILKYKIYRGRGSSLDEQIDILKEYLAQEKDSERWSYELARLYKEAGRAQECINTCDDLVLWYQSGKYVIKALELKKKIAPLTPRQQEIYDARFDQPEEEEPEEASYLQQARAESLAIQQDAIKSELAEDISRAARTRDESSAAPAANEKAEPGKEDGTGPAKAGEAEGPQTGTAMAREARPTREISQAQFAEAGEEAGRAEEIRQTLPQYRQPEGPAARPEGQGPETGAETGHPYDEDHLKENLAESMKKILSGVGPKDQVDEREAEYDRAIDQSKEDQEAAVASREMGLAMSRREAETRKAEAPKLTIDDILLSMDDKGASVRRSVAEGPDSLPAGVLPAEEESRMNAQAAARMNLVAAQNLGEVGADETAGPAGQKAGDLEAGVRDQGQTGGLEAGAEGQGQAADQAARQAEPAAEDQEAGETDQDRILEAKTRVLPTDQIRALHEQFLSRESISAGNQAETRTPAGESQAPEQGPAAEGPAPDQTSAGESQAPEQGPAAEGPAPDRISAGESQAPEQGPAAEGPAPDRTSAGESQVLEQGPAAEGPAPGQTSAGESQAADRTAPEGEQVMREIRPEEGRDLGPKKRPESALKPYQRNLFRGFLEVGDLEEQIAKAIAQAESKGDDKTSRTGNVLILGAHGCGKTTLATGIAKAVAEDRGTHSVKMARIYAADLNRKDIAATVAKIAGGVLIIEEAGDLEDGIVDQLTTAMEFRTDGTIVILEDEQRYIHDLLMRHPRFTMKFTAQIYIPAFTSRQLADFGELYAQSKDCTFSEEARKALIARLDAAARGGEAVSITNVVELTSRAIANSGKFFRRIQSAKKRYDDQNRVILRTGDLH